MMVAEDLTLATDRKIKGALAGATAVRERTGSQLLSTRLDAMIAEFQEELDERERRSEERAEL